MHADKSTPAKNHPAAAPTAESTRMSARPTPVLGSMPRFPALFGLQPNLAVGHSDGRSKHEVGLVADPVVGVDSALHSARQRLAPAVPSYMEPRSSHNFNGHPGDITAPLPRAVRDVPATGLQAEEAQATYLADAALHTHVPQRFEPLNSITGQAGLLLDEGQPVPPAIRQKIEFNLGWSMAAVRLHSGTESMHAAEAQGARAFALGSHIYFGENQFKNESHADQRLLAHELVHIALHAPFGPALPRLSPDNEQTLDTILSASPIRAATLFAFLRTHSDQVQDAHQLLMDRLFGSPEERRQALPLLTRLLREHPGELATAEEQIEEHSSAYRTEATDAVTSLWTQYESGAHLYALQQWTQNRLRAEQRNRPRPQSGQPAPLPSVLEAQLATQLAACDVQMAEARTERTRLYRIADQALSTLMDASAPLSYLQEEALRDLSDRLTGSANTRRRDRLRVAEARRLLDYRPTSQIERQFAQVTREQERTASALATAEAELQLTEADEEGDTPPQQRVHRQRLAGARRTLAATKRAADRAAIAAAPEGAQNPELALYMRSRDDTQREEAQSVLDTLAPRRNEHIDPLLTGPNDMQEQAGYTWQPGDMLTESDRWDIHQQALQFIENGFPHFSSEANQQLVLPRLSRIASDRQNVGLSATIAVATYTGHGPGQYDISESAGQRIQANRPDDADLTVALGPAADGSRRRFIWQSSQVRNLGTIDSHSADEDTLAKLIYGYFGRSWSRQQVDSFISGVTTGLPARNPDPTRVIAALYFKNTVELPAGATPAFDSRRAALRTSFENEVRAELATAGISVSGPLLETVDASSGQFDAAFAIHQNTMRAATNPRTGRPFARSEGTAPVMAAATRVLARSTPATAAIETLIRDMRAPAAGLNGGRSGPAVQLVHHYQEVDGNDQPLSTEAWVTVSYRHLRSMSADLSVGQAVEQGTDLGAVGSSGNAVSPHVHMEIAVYDRDPGRFTRQEPIAYLTPFQFFPFVRRRNRSSTTP